MCISNLAGSRVVCSICMNLILLQGPLSETKGDYQDISFDLLRGVLWLIVLFVTSQNRMRERSLGILTVYITWYTAICTACPPPPPISFFVLYKFCNQQMKIKKLLILHYCLLFVSLLFHFVCFVDVIGFSVIV